MLGLVLPAAQVPAALSIGTAASATSRALVFRRSVRWDVVRWFVPAAVPATAFGAWLLSLAQPLWVEFLLGLFLVANIAVLFRRRPAPGPARSRPLLLLAVGAGAGFLSGFTGAVGVVFNDFYLRHGLAKEEVVATRGADELLLHVIKIGLYASFGLLTPRAAAIGALVALAAVASSVAARRLLSRVAEPLFRILNHAAMVLAGAAMLASSGGALASRYGLSVSARLDAGLEARLAVREWAVSLEWKAGHAPAVERTLAPADVPGDVREAADDMRGDARGAQARYEAVRTWEGLSYEIHVDGRTRRMVATD